MVQIGFEMAIRGIYWRLRLNVNYCRFNSVSEKTIVLFFSF